MIRSQIYIYSGPVHSGKTTRLANWVAEQNNIDGILAPVHEGKRYLKRIASGEKRLLDEVGSQFNAADVYSIGAFAFSKAVFNWGVEALQDALTQSLHWLVIDEIGFLELDDRGLEPAVKQALDPDRKFGPENVLIVVREKLVEKIMAHYELSDRVKLFNFPDTGGSKQKQWLL